MWLVISTFSMDGAVTGFRYAFQDLRVPRDNPDLKKHRCPIMASRHNAGRNAGSKVFISIGG